MYEKKCIKCGSLELFTKKNASATGLYCSDCGAFQKWLGKDELQAFEHSMESRICDERMILTQSGLERLSGDYNCGYRTAIQDVIEIFEYVQEDLKSHHKNLTYKIAQQLLKCCLENREKIRERKNGGFIRFNAQLGDFEYFEYKNSIVKHKEDKK